MFPDRQTLKDHMRKKQHRKLNPDNSVYDKYYIVNYLELGKTWREVDKEEERERPACCGDIDERYVCLSVSLYLTVSVWCDGVSCLFLCLSLSLSGVMVCLFLCISLSLSGVMVCLVCFSVSHCLCLV